MIKPHRNQCKSRGIWDPILPITTMVLRTCACPLNLDVLFIHLFRTIGVYASLFVSFLSLIFCYPIVLLSFISFHRYFHSTSYLLLHILFLFTSFVTSDSNTLFSFNRRHVKRFHENRSHSFLSVPKLVCKPFFGDDYIEAIIGRCSALRVLEITTDTARNTEIGAPN